MKIFNIGEFYASILLIKNIMIEKDPIFPLFMMIHESKKFKNHNEFFFLIDNILKFTEYENVIIITDRESSIIRAINFIKLNHFFCTNHIRNDVKFWLNKNNIEKTMKNKVKFLIHQLINCKTLQRYNDVLKDFKDDENNCLNAKLSEYLEIQILPNIMKNIENDKYGIFQNENPTNNM